MIEVSGDLMSNYMAYVTGATTALLPLWGSVCGVFLAFAVANMTRYFILRTVGKK